MAAAGFVLTGGNSTRMGRDKALLSFGGEHLVHTIATTLSTVVNPVTLVGQPQRYWHLPWLCLPDLRLGGGPLAGLHTALTATSAEFNLVVACDMPSLRPDWLRNLLNAAESSEALCMATQDREGRVHPLCGIYRKQCLPYVVRALDAGELRMTALLNAIGAEYLRAESGLENVNTALDWTQWQKAQIQAGR